MAKKNFTRRDFLGKTTAGIAGAAVASGISSVSLMPCISDSYKGKYEDKYPAGSFAREVEKLPIEELYDYHKHLSTAPVHIPRRDPKAKPEEGELALPGQGWKLICNPDNSIIIKNAVRDFQDYLEKSQNVKVVLLERDSLEDWKHTVQSIVVGTREQLPGCGLTLKGPKDYEIEVSPGRVMICGYDERGAIFGLYNLEARMNSREAPFLPGNLKTIRHSLFDTRMIMSWMGWMEFPDQLLSHLVHDGYDGILASVYANPNGDRTTAENSTDSYARLMYKVRNLDPARVRDLIDRASRFGIKVYTQIIYLYEGTQESEAGLRKLVRDILNKFPDIRGYVLLTEGFWYREWGHSRGTDKGYMEKWARNWCKAVGIVEEECHRVDPSIEILPWEYNINARPENIELKKYFIKQLPAKTIPMPTWEKGKSFELDDMKGYLGDYSLNQIGPAETTIAQIEEAGKRGMKVYSKVDTSASWQFGTIPYLPCPYQWWDRYMALEKHGIKGTLESWSFGFKPNFISELRAWTCWSDSPSRDELFNSMAARIFGNENKERVIKAWEYFSQAIQLVPDTGASMGTNHAVGNPLFFREPPARTLTFNYSWTDYALWQRCCYGSSINPYWPFTNTRMVFYPDFSNQTNRAESYARGRSGVQAAKDIKILPVFLKYLDKAAGLMEEGLKLYREAALKSPESKHQKAVHEVIIAEQIQRMMQSNHAILEFEDIRLQFANEQNSQKAGTMLDRMEGIVRDEITRTELSLLAATRDSRLGFEFEQDYVYTPYSLKEKLEVLEETLNEQLPNARSSLSNKNNRS